jgi:hypothetical protein
MNPFGQNFRCADCGIESVAIFDRTLSAAEALTFLERQGWTWLYEDVTKAGAPLALCERCRVEWEPCEAPHVLKLPA